MEILEKDIIKDINHNKKIIKYHQLYSIKSLIIKLLLKSGILLDYAYPYILSILIMLNVGFIKIINHLIMIMLKKLQQKIYMIVTIIPKLILITT